MSTAELTTGWHTVEIEGVRQAYEVAGSGPICVVHSGGPGIHADYLRMPPLERHLTMIYLDPIGTGRSGLLPAGDYSVPEYTRRAALLLDRLDVIDVIFLGHSHGGFVALQYGITYPERVRGLVVYDSAPVSYSLLADEANRQMTAFVERWPDRPEAAEAGRMWSARRSGEYVVNDGDSHRHYLNTIRPAYYADFRRTVEDLGGTPTLEVTYDPARKPEQWDARDRLGTIEEPTLVIAGAYDFICPPVWSHELYAKIPHARLLELKESGHFGHVEQPAEFLKGVLAFAEAV
jgi:pimeloyl-ACP methyl ester carboxylesterase